jgi:hypothetical protein
VEANDPILMQKVWKGITGSTNRRHFFLNHGHSKSPAMHWGQMTLHMEPDGAVHRFLAASAPSPKAKHEQKDTTAIDPPPPEPVKIQFIPGHLYEDQEYTPVRSYSGIKGKLRHQVHNATHIQTH